MMNPYIQHQLTDTLMAEIRSEAEHNRIARAARRASSAARRRDGRPTANPGSWARRHRRLLAPLAVALPLGMAGLAASVLTPAPAQAAVTTSVTRSFAQSGGTATARVQAAANISYTSVAAFSYDGDVQQHFTVPPMVTTLTFEAVGGGGGWSGTDGGPGGSGGAGGIVTGALPVTPGEVLDLCVGGRGGNDGTAGQDGGCEYFSGGSGGAADQVELVDTEPAGGGGAGSVIAKPGPSTVPALGLALPYTPLVVAGGGGGGGAALPDDPGSYGGNGGNGGKPAVDGGGGAYFESGFSNPYGYGGTGAGSSSAAGTDGQVGASGFADSGFTWAGGGGGGGGLPGGTGGADGNGGGGGGGGGESWAALGITDSMGLADTTPENGSILLKWTDPYDLYVADSGFNAIGIYGPASAHRALAGAIIGADTGLDQPEGVAFDAAGRLYVANARANTITEYAPGASGDAAPVATIAGPETRLDDPRSIAVGSDDRLYVVDSGSNAVTVYAPGASGDAVPVATIAGSATEITKPTGIAVDLAGHAYVSNSGNNSVTAYIPNANGNILPSIVIKGAKTGLDQPNGLTFDNSGALLVTNGTGTITRYNATVSGDQAPLAVLGGSATGLADPQQTVFDPADGSLVADSATSGKLLSWPDGATGNKAPSGTVTTSSNTVPAQLAINPFLDGTPLYAASPSLYVASYGLNTISVYSSAPAGPRYAGTISGSGTGLDRPEGVAFDVTGRLYVTNSAANTITEYAPGAIGDASPVATIAGQKTGLSDPGFIALDGAGHLYVVNNGTNSVTEYAQGANGDASPVATIAGPATGITHPEGITVDPAGNIYLSNRENNSVTTYAKGANGNVKPIAVLSGAKTGLDRPIGLSYQAGHLVVSNDSGGVATFSTPAKGDQAPASVLAVTDTGLANAEQAVIDPADDTVMVDSLTQGTVDAWPAAATGDTAPIWSLLVNANASSEPTQMALNPLSP